MIFAAGVLCGGVSPTGAQIPARAVPTPQAAPPRPLKGQGVDLAVSALDAATGDAIPGVQIELHRLRTATDPREWSYASTTDAQGKSVISNIVAERYSISATLSGRIPVSGSEQILALAPSAKPKAVVLRMARSAQIQGVVEDGDHNPLAHARVELLEERWTAGQRTLARIRTAEPTGPTGRFSFEDLLTGSYYLRARPDPSVIAQQLRDTSSLPDAEARHVAFVNTMYPGSPFLEGASPIILSAASNQQDVRIQVQKSRYYAVRGHVDNLSPAVANPGLIFIRTVAFDSRFPFIVDEPYDEPVPVRIARDGTFAYETGLPPGQYWAGYTPGGQDNLFGGADLRVIDKDVELKPELWKGFPLAGRIVYDDGTPAGNLQATLRTFWSHRSVRTDDFTTDAQGAFNRSLYSDGTFRIEFQGGINVLKIDKDSRTSPGPEFEVTRDGGPLLITVTRQGASISGSVKLRDSSQGYPRGVVTLAIDPADPLDVPLRKRLNAPNNFTFEHLEAGRYRLCAWEEEGTEINRVLGNPAYDSRLANLCESVEVKVGEAASVVLKQIRAADMQ